MITQNYKPYYSNSWAIIIGINKYKYVSPLYYACNDADAIYNALIDKLDFPKSNIILL
ncbi:caspase family protein, partial [bacterium]|nr:caspase family protein [bacterium]